MSDDLEVAKLRTASPASGTAELIRRCHWAHDEITRLRARVAELEADSDHLKAVVAAYEEIAGPHEKGALRSALEKRAKRRAALGDDRANA